MSEKIVQLNEEAIKGQIKKLVRGSVEETLNELLEKAAESLTQAARYERSEARQGYRSGHYDTAASPRPPATSRSICLGSKACPSRRPHPAVSPPGEQRGGSPHRDVSGGRFLCYGPAKTSSIVSRS